jgi:hypothetical protein
MTTKKEFISQLEKERSYILQELNLREQNSQRQFNEKSRLLKEKKSKFKELEIPLIFGWLINSIQVKNGVISENFINDEASMTLMFNIKDNKNTADYSYNYVSAILKGNNLVIEGHDVYTTDLTTKLDNGSYLWTVSNVLNNRKNFHPKQEKIEATIAGVIIKTILIPKFRSGNHLQ